MNNTTVNYKGVSLEIYYDIDEGDPGDNITAPTADRYEIFSVEAGGVDILDLLTWSQEEELKELLIFANN